MPLDEAEAHDSKICGVKIILTINVAVPTQTEVDQVADFNLTKTTSKEFYRLHETIFRLWSAVSSTNPYGRLGSLPQVSSAVLYILQKHAYWNSQLKHPD